MRSSPLLPLEAPALRLRVIGILAMFVAVVAPSAQLLGFSLGEAWLSHRLLAIGCPDRVSGRGISFPLATLWVALGRWHPGG